MIGATTTLKSRIPAIIAQANARGPVIVEKTARDIEAGCKWRSRVDTGQMKSGWSAEPESEWEWRVYNPVEHSLYNEFGTAKISPQPMLVPSVDEAREPFTLAIKQLYD